MPWPAVLTSKLSPFNGVNITVFLTPFLMEVHLNSKNFDVTSYPNKLTPIPPLKAHAHPSPINNHYFELAGDGPHFATLKAILLQFICSLLSAGTTSTTHNNFGDFYTTYDFGSDLQTPMAGSVTCSSDLIDELTYTYRRIIYMA